MTPKTLKNDAVLEVQGEDKIILTMILYLTAHPYFREYMEGIPEEVVLNDDNPIGAECVWLESCINDALPFFEDTGVRNELLYSLQQVSNVDFYDVFDAFVQRIQKNIEERIKAGSAETYNKLH